MAEILSYDPAGDPEVVGAIESDQAESLAIGEEMINQAEQRLAGKYKDAQELEKAYIELEKKLGSRDEQEETPEPEAQDQQETSDYATQIDAISRAAEEYESKGQLSAETLAEFEKMSSKELIQAYFEYEQESSCNVMLLKVSRAFCKLILITIQNSVGGEAAYQQLVGWAADRTSQPS